MPPPLAREPILAIESVACERPRILVVKLDHRGDFIMARPGLEALRAAFPASPITLVCGPWNRDEARGLGLFDRIFECGFFPEVAGEIGRATSLSDLRRRFAEAIQGRSFDLAIDLRLHEDTRDLLTLVDATFRAGFGTAARFPWLDIALPLPNPTESGRADRRQITAQRFRSHLGNREEDAIVSDAPVEGRAPGAIMIYGPYEDIAEGTWELDVLIETPGEAFDLGFDVAADGGREILGEGSLRVGGEPHPRVVLELAAPVHGLELRLRVGPAGAVGPFRFGGCCLTRRSAFEGPHQSEMQYLLVSLIGLRMRYPYRTRELD